MRALLGTSKGFVTRPVEVQEHTHNHCTPSTNTWIASTGASATLQHSCHQQRRRWRPPTRHTARTSNQTFRVRRHNHAHAPGKRQQDVTPHHPNLEQSNLRLRSFARTTWRWHPHLDHRWKRHDGGATNACTVALPTTTTSQGPRAMTRTGYGPSQKHNSAP